MRAIDERAEADTLGSVRELSPDNGPARRRTSRKTQYGAYETPASGRDTRDWFPARCHRGGRCVTPHAPSSSATDARPARADTTTPGPGVDRVPPISVPVTTILVITAPQILPMPLPIHSGPGGVGPADLTEPIDRGSGARPAAATTTGDDADLPPRQDAPVSGTRPTTQRGRRMSAATASGTSRTGRPASASVGTPRRTRPIMSPDLVAHRGRAAGGGQPCQ